jgi:hypothetical protein
MWVSLSALPTLVSDLSSQSASLRCSTEIRHFPPPSHFIFIYWLIVLVLYAPYSFGFYCHLFPILILPMSPGLALGTLPWSSHEFRLFYRPIVFVVYLFICQLHILPYFLFPSLILFIYMVSSVSFTCTCQKFSLPERLPST